LNIPGSELLLGATAGLVLVSTVAASLSLVLRRSMRRASPVGQLADSVAAGVFLGIGLVHMLPEAAHGFADAGGDGRLMFLVAGVTLLFLRAIDRLGGAESARLQALIVTGVLVVHTVLTGFALGAEDAHGAIVMMFAALAIHKAAEAFAFGRLLSRSALPAWLAGLLLIVFVGALPLGVIAALTIASAMSPGSIAVPLILAVGAGTFLHFGLNHSHLLGLDDDWRTLGARIAGFVLMAAFALFAGH